MPAKLGRPAALFLLSLLCIAAGCRNGSKRDDPFLQRRLIPPPPPGNYAPPAGGNYYPSGAPALQPVPGPQFGQTQSAPPTGSGGGEIRPASALGGSSDGWVPARDVSTTPFDRSAGVAIGGATDSPATTATSRSATPASTPFSTAAAEPRLLVVTSEPAMRPLLTESNTGDAAPTTSKVPLNIALPVAQSENPAQSDHTDVAAVSTVASSSATSLDWSAPRRP